MEQTKCVKCGNDMPLLRLIKYGYHSCVQCSTTPRVGCAPITNHKTGNAIQIVPMELANRINKAAQRQGYGVCKGMKSSF
jgi:hypothetical protein